MNPFFRFFIRFLKIFIRSLFRAASRNHDSSPPEQISQPSTSAEPAPTETAPAAEPEPPHRRRHRRTSVTETTTRTTTISESQSSPELAQNK